jgi:hypothetical protein
VMLPQAPKSPLATNLAQAMQALLHSPLLPLFNRTTSNRV